MGEEVMAEEAATIAPGTAGANTRIVTANDVSAARYHNRILYNKFVCFAATYIIGIHGAENIKNRPPGAIARI